MAFFIIGAKNNLHDIYCMKTPNKLLLIALLLFVNFLSAQTTLTSTKTEKHVAVKGTPVFLSPPLGFESATSFVGFQNSAMGASIMIVQLSGPYNEVTAGFSPANMEKRGMRLLEKEAITLNGHHGILLTVEQFSAAHGYNFRKYTLVLNLGERSTLMINGSFPESVKESLEEEVKKTIITSYYDQSIKTDHLSTLDFSVDLSATKFKLSEKSLTGSLILEGPQKEFMIIAKSVRKLAASDKKGSSIDALKAVKTIEYIRFEEGREVTQDNAEGYQMTAVVNYEGKPAKALQTILFGENYSYVFFQVIKQDGQERIKDFETIVRSFKRK